MRSAVTIPACPPAVGSRIEYVVKKFAAMTLLALMTVPAIPAHADPVDVVDPGANYNVFLQAIAGDGIVIGAEQAIREGIDACVLMRPPTDASLWDAAQHVKSIHPDWRIGSALDFSNRAVQDICPNRGSF